MSEKLGVPKLKEVVVHVAKVLNAVSAFAHKQGLIALFPVIGEAQDLVKVDWAGVRDEIVDLSAPESEEVQAALATELKLQNPNVQVKVLEAIDCAQAAAAVIVKELALVSEAKVVVDKVKALLAPVPA